MEQSFIAEARSLLARTYRGKGWEESLRTFTQKVFAQKPELYEEQVLPYLSSHLEGGCCSVEVSTIEEVEFWRKLMPWACLHLCTNSLGDMQEMLEANLSGTPHPLRCSFDASSSIDWGSGLDFSKQTGGVCLSITHVSCTENDLRHFVYASDSLEHVRSLELGNCRLGEKSGEDWEVDLSCLEGFRLLEELIIWNNPVGERGIKTLQESDVLKTVTRLFLQDTFAFSRVVRGFLRDPALSELRALTIGGEYFTSVEDIKMLVEASSAENLEELNLFEDDSSLSKEAFALLVESDLFSRLRVLELPGNCVPDTDARVDLMISSGQTQNLEILSLQDCELSKNGVAALFSTDAFPSLRSLTLEGNRFGDEGLEQMLQKPQTLLHQLEELSLTYCGLTDRGAVLLMESEAFRGLQKLTLNSNKFSKEMSQALLEWAPEVMSFQL